MAMQRPSTALDQSSLIRLRLIKFSYATDPSGETEKFTWKHTTQELVVIFDSFRSGPVNDQGQRSKMMSVIQGTQALESIDIEGKIREAAIVMETMKGLGIEIRNEQLPISALVRCPLLAIRYNLPDSKTRRLQLKFGSDSDFQVAYELLTHMGCQVSQSIPQGAAPPSTASSTVEGKGPSYPASSLAKLVHRPEVKPSRDSNASGTAVTPIQPSISRIQQGTIGYPRPQTPARMNTPLSSQSLLHQGWTPTFASISPQLLHRSATLPHNVVESQRDATTYPSTEQHRAPSIGQGIQIRSEDPTRTWTSPRNASYPSLGPPDRNDIASAVRTHFPHLQTIEEIQSATPIGRPYSAPDPQMDTLLQLIPPRRELPFRRDGSHTGSSQPSSSSVDLPPLPRPSFSGNATKANGSAPPTSKSSDLLANTHQLPQSPVSSMDRVFAQISAVTPFGGTDTLGTYATQSVDDRATLIGDWMMQHIEDDSFLTLCEDVAGCWRRIGLGL